MDVGPYFVVSGMRDVGEVAENTTMITATLADPSGKVEALKG